MMTEEKMILKKILKEDEAVYEMQMMCELPIYFIGPNVKDKKDICVSECLEETLYRLLDDDCLSSTENSEDIIYKVLRAQKFKNADDDYIEEYMYSIDLGYVIFDFLPTAIISTDIVYCEKMDEYSIFYFDKQICKKFLLPEDPTDDDILIALNELLAIETDEYIVCEYDNIEGYFVESIIDSDIVLKIQKN